MATTGLQLRLNHLLDLRQRLFLCRFLDNATGSIKVIIDTHKNQALGHRLLGIVLLNHADVVGHANLERLFTGDECQATGKLSNHDARGMAHTFLIRFHGKVLGNKLHSGNGRNSDRALNDGSNDLGNGTLDCGVHDLFENGGIDHAARR